MMLFDVSTLYFETDAADGFREPGFSKERRLEPQITLGLLTDASGFPLTVKALEGNKAETATMLPVINAFKTAHQLSDVTVLRRRRDDLRGQSRLRCRLRGCRSFWAPASRTCPMWCANGVTSTPMKRNRYIQLSGAIKTVNRQLEAKTRAPAGWKGYTTNLTSKDISIWSAPGW